MSINLKIKELIKASEYFKLRKGSAVADLMLWGFARDAIENATAVSCLLEYNPFVHLSYANARSIFETAQNSCCLSTHDKYKDAGFKAWFYFLNKDRDWVQKFISNGFEHMGYVTGEDWLHNETKNLAKKIAKFSSKEAEDLLIEFESHRVIKQNRPDNWLGKNMANAQAESYKKLSPSLTNAKITEIMEINRTIYARISREVHAGMNFHQIRIAKFEEYGLMHHPERNNELLKDSVILLIESSLDEIITALNYAKKS
jgi:hypothetical protein